MNESAYVDTSALAKRYLEEPGSEEFDLYLGEKTSVAISRLTVVEMRCLLGRRRRNRDINANAEARAWAALGDDIARGFLEVHPLEDRHAIDACDLLGSLAAIPLRSLDALHLAISMASGARTIATADDTFAAASRALGLRVEWFGQGRNRRRK